MSNQEEAEAPQDITIKCGDCSWTVDQEKICQQSEVIAKQMSSGMQEAISKVIHHDTFDATNIGRMISYVKDETYKLEQERSLFADEDGFKARLAATPSLLNEILMAHTEVYAVAQYYYMKELKTYAMKRFQVAGGRGWREEGFADVVIEIYRLCGLEDRKADTRNLLHVLLEYAANNRDAIMRSSSMMKQLRTDPDLQLFVADLYHKSIQKEILDKSCHAQVARVTESSLADAKRAEQSMRNDTNVMRRVMQAVPSLPGICKNTECAKEFPANLVFALRSSNDTSNPDHRINHEGDWVINCAACGHKLH